QVSQFHLLSAEFDLAVAEESQKIPERALARIFRSGDVQDPRVVSRHPVAQLLAGVLESLRVALRADRRDLIDECFQCAKLTLQPVVIDQTTLIDVLAR